MYVVCSTSPLGASPVKFNVAQLLKSAAGDSREYDVHEDITGIDNDLDVTQPLVGKVKFIRTASGILVTGRFATVVRTSCRRCWKLVDVPIEIDLEEEFRPSVDILTGAVMAPREGEDAATRIDGHHILDVAEVVRQSLWLAMPVSSLCSPHCRGLCPHCGANLNEGPCGCQHEEGDPRLAALRELL